MNSEFFQILIMILLPTIFVSGILTAGYIMDKKVKKNLEKRGLK